MNDQEKKQNSGNPCFFYASDDVTEQESAQLHPNLHASCSPEENREVLPAHSDISNLDRRAGEPMWFAAEYKAAIEACERQLEEQRRYCDETELSKEVSWRNRVICLVLIAAIVLLVWLAAKAISVANATIR